MAEGSCREGAIDEQDSPRPRGEGGSVGTQGTQGEKLDESYVSSGDAEGRLRRERGAA